MRKNVTDRFRIKQEGEVFHVESLVRDDVDGIWLLQTYDALKAAKKNIEDQMRQIPQKMEMLKNQLDVLMPKDILSLEKKIQAIEPYAEKVRADLKAQEEKLKAEMAAKNAKTEELAKTAA